MVKWSPTTPATIFAGTSTIESSPTTVRQALTMMATMSSDGEMTKKSETCDG